MSKTGALNSDLTVKGVSRLRVVDMSAFVRLQTRVPAKILTSLSVSPTSHPATPTVSSIP